LLRDGQLTEETRQQRQQIDEERDRGKPVEQHREHEPGGGGGGTSASAYEPQRVLLGDGSVPDDRADSEELLGLGVLRAAVELLPQRQLVETALVVLDASERHSFQYMQEEERNLLNAHAQR